MLSPSQSSKSWHCWLWSLCSHECSIWHNGPHAPELIMLCSRIPELTVIVNALWPPILMMTLLFSLPVIKFQLQLFHIPMKSSCSSKLLCVWSVFKTWEISPWVFATLEGLVTRVCSKLEKFCCKSSSHSRGWWLKCVQNSRSFTSHSRGEWRFHSMGSCCVRVNKSFTQATNFHLRMNECFTQGV